VPVSIRSVLILAAVIIVALWISASPAQAGDDVRMVFTSLVTFFQHAAGLHS
jgi:hypothetical protein